MLIDSHCHLNFPELVNRLPEVFDHMRNEGVDYAMTVCTTLEEFDDVLAIARARSNLVCTLGVHPDNGGQAEPTVEGLIDHARAASDKVVAIGETGLDYFRIQAHDAEFQRSRFRCHIRAAKALGLPLVIHTRSAAADTLRILTEESADQVGGVMHCFTETLDFARQALDMGFLISFSGIVTFKNAANLREVARYVPSDRLLVETDSPYLAPVPHRGKSNEPAWVKHVAQCVADERQTTLSTLARQTSENFFAMIKRRPGEGLSIGV